MPAIVRLLAKGGRIRYDYGRTSEPAPKEERTYGGRVYHSKAEAAVAAELEILKKVGKIKDWKPQAPFSMDVNGKRVCVHYVDFLVYEFDGSVRVIEVKGFPTKEWKLKYNLFRACYPEIEYEVRKAGK